MNPFVEFFRAHSELTAPGPYTEAMAGLPSDIEQLCRIVQGLIIHPAWLPEYGVSAPQTRILAEQQARTVERILSDVLELDGRPLTDARPPALRAVGTCRNYSLLLCSALRTQGVAARLRCGFAPYFSPDRYVEHWICEYWSDEGGYWVRVDPQLDGLQRGKLAVAFDPLDVPIEAYLYAGEVWIMYRRGRVDAAHCGTYDLCGPGFIKGNIVRDILALNKVEPMPWDTGWGILEDLSLDELDRGELGYIDRLARCSANSLVHLARSFFEDDDRIRLPEGWDLSMAPGLERFMANGEAAQRDR